MQSIQYLDVAFEIQSASNILATSSLQPINDEPIIINGNLILELIVRCTCDAYGITDAEMRQKSRRRHLVTCRQTIAYLADKHAKLNQEQVAYRINQERSTLVHSCDVMESLIWQKDNAGLICLGVEKELMNLIYNKPTN